MYERTGTAGSEPLFDFLARVPDLDKRCGERHRNKLRKHEVVHPESYTGQWIPGPEVYSLGLKFGLVVLTRK